MRSYRKELMRLETINKLFECIRLIDIESESLYAEYQIPGSLNQIPTFDFLVRQELYHKCIAGDTTMYWMEQEGRLLLLFTAVPVEINKRKLIMECVANVTGKMDVNRLLAESTDLLESAYRLSVTDELTGLYNRRYINQMLPHVIKNCAINKIPFSVIFTDLDYFKEINDSYGHLAGDCLLYEFGMALQRNIRKSTDWAARYGGDEFLLCLVGIDKETAKMRAEAIRKEIESKTFEYHEHKIKMTCSLGIYTEENFHPLPTCDFIFQEIDKMLYEAKRVGKNIVR